MGLFTSADPAGQYFNSYSYCNGNSINKTDPDGKLVGEGAGVIDAAEWFLILSAMTIAYVQYSHHQDEMGMEKQSFIDFVIQNIPEIIHSEPEKITPPAPIDNSIANVPAAVDNTNVIITPAEQPIQNGNEQITPVEQLPTAMESQNQTGSYTITFESGKSYFGKGSESRMEQSAKKIAAKEGDKVVSKTHTPAKNKREAFKDEARKLAADGGPKSESNYNKIESPGKKYLEEDEEY